MTMTLRRSDNLLTRLRETPVLSDSDNARPVEQIPESNTVPNISDTPTREEVIAIWKSLNMDVKKIKYGFAPKNEQLTRADDKKDSVTQSLIKDKTFACHSRDVRKKKSIDNRHVKFKPSKSKRCPSFPLNHRRNVKGRKNPVLRRRLLLQRLRQRSERYVYNYQSAQRLRSYDLLSTRGFSGNRFNLRNECNENPERDRSNIVICEPALEAEQFCGRCASYYPEGGWGWTIVVVGVIVQVLSHGLQLGGGTGPIACAAAIKYHVSPLYTHGCLAALSAGVSLALSPITVALGVCKSTRVTAVYGGLVVALGCLYTSFATQFHQLFFSYGTVVGVGVGLTRDCSTLMVAQYFKRRRELVEIFIVSGSGLGIAVMSTFIKGAIRAIGWRLGLQAVTGVVFVTFILGTFYRLGDTVELLQAYLCLAWAAGCVAFGLLVRQNSAECQIARQYLTQAAVFVCGLATMALTAVEGSYKAYVLFAWVYGIFCGGYHYTLKIYTFERVRFRNFVRTWGFVQCAQAVPIAIGVPLSGYINVYCGSKAGYYFSSTCSLIGSLTLFCIDLHRRNKHTIEIGAPANCESTCEPSRYNRSPEEELHAAADAATALDNMFKHDMV